MYRLFQLLYSYRAFLLFLVFEIICFWLLVRNNPFHSAAFYHSSSSLAGSLYEMRKNTVQYINLPHVNDELANDNAHLRKLLSESYVPIVVNKVTDTIGADEQPIPYDYLAAKVINKSTSFQHNYITINKGSRHGIEKGMGVISGKGVVGKIVSVSNNFSTVSTMLNVDIFVSSMIRRNNTFCTAHWDGRDPLEAQLLYVPRHIDLKKGDSIVTSGYNAIFPENIPLGTIVDFNIQENATFYDVKIALANDFYKLSYVYIIKNPAREEILQTESENKQESE